MLIVPWATDRFCPNNRLPAVILCAVVAGIGLNSKKETQADSCTVTINSNPMKEIGALAHSYGCISVMDTTTTYAMIPIDMERDNVDIIMASAQKGLMSMTGLPYIIGKTAVIEASKDYPKRSYYTNLYQQYSFIKEKGEMHFTPTCANHLCHRAGH